MALVLLRSGSDKILQICLKTGFQDISYFNRKFKQIVGMTPGEYRKQRGIA
jgi:AraC-like DNA-binding protein